VPPTFTSSMEANQFVDSYAVKKTKSLEQRKKMRTLGIHFSRICGFIFFNYIFIGRR
jgi:hypothetical protein